MTDSLGGRDGAPSLPALSAPTSVVAPAEALRGNLKQLVLRIRTHQTLVAAALEEIERYGWFRSWGYEDFRTYCVAELEVAPAAAYRMIRVVRSFGGHWALVRHLPFDRLSTTGRLLVAGRATAEEVTDRLLTYEEPTRALRRWAQQLLYEVEEDEGGPEAKPQPYESLLRKSHRPAPASTAPPVVVNPIRSMNGVKVIRRIISRRDIFTPEDVVVQIRLFRPLYERALAALAGVTPAGSFATRLASLLADGPHCPASASSRSAPGSPGQSPGGGDPESEVTPPR